MSAIAPSSVQKHLKPTDFIVSKTDTRGNIIYGNRIFIDMSGHAEHELIGAPHSILRHPDMPAVVFQLLWERIKNRQEIFAYVKNLCKDGSYYWVFANVTATTDAHGEVRDYHSVRRKPSQKAMDVIPDLYQKLLHAERNGGQEASKKLLNTLLNDQGMDYDRFILFLQH
ncbi:MAG: PAS domain-containing protein [Campylobacterota bacterium]